jgi:hypothetical protein
MSQSNSLLISLPPIERTALVFLTERENEPGKSGLFLFEKCMTKMLFFMSNFSILRRCGKANPVCGSRRRRVNLGNDWVIRVPDYDLDGVPTTSK